MVERKCVMGEFCDEIELDLGLAIGKNVEKSEKWRHDSSLSPIFEIGGRVVDLEKKREIQALRREGLSGSRNGDHLVSEFDAEERECKKNKVGISGSEYDDMRNVNLNLSSGEQNMNRNDHGSCLPYPDLRMQYPYSRLQYVPFGNAFGFPYVMPCLPSGGGAAAGENVRNLFQPVADRTVRPSHGNVNLGVKMSNECDDSEEKSSKDGENRRPVVSSRSPTCSFSGISDYRSSSSLQEGTRSGETRSYSSHSLPEQFQNTDSNTNDTKGQCEHSASSKPNDSTQGTGETTTNKPISSSENLKELKKMTGKPPKPQSHNNNTVAFSQMPCVSTTGNGPNGKSITGFLYRYTKAEVSIVCVCHGKSFSPAEFVEHAGGTDISNPLKHITVIPYAFR